ECVQAEVGEPSDVAPGSRDAEDPTHRPLHPPELDRLGPTGRIAGDDHTRACGRRYREVDLEAAPRGRVRERTVGGEREAVGVLPDVADEVGALAAEEEHAAA